MDDSQSKNKSINMLIGVFTPASDLFKTDLLVNGFYQYEELTTEEIIELRTNEYIDEEIDENYTVLELQVFSHEDVKLIIKLAKKAAFNYKHRN